MITLNDYLYSGDTVLKILQKYTEDLRKEAKKNHNEVDLVHSNFLLQITELLEHNDFLTAQSQKIREFYKYMAHEYPFLAFTFKGRIKSLIRAEEKFNGYVVEYIYDYYRENGTYPSVAELKNKLSCFRDFIAYRIVVCMPRCHLKPGEEQEQASIRYLYEIANVLPGFLEERGGRICKLKIVGSLKTLTIGKELEIRRTLSSSHLFSSAFVVDKGELKNGVPEWFLLTGAGWGHGVGLCQIGAAVMGERGYTYDEILLHYYKGADIRRFY